MLRFDSPVLRWGYFYCTLSTVLTTMAITPETTQAEDRLKFKRETIQQLLGSLRSARANYNHIRICISMWQSFALVDQRGTVCCICDDITNAFQVLKELRGYAMDEHEDQRPSYDIIAWKWSAPLDPEKERSIYVHPDVWVKAPDDMPKYAENTDNLMLASNVNPRNEKFEVYYP